MEGCFFCQGPLDAATGRCQQCGRVQPAQEPGASSDTPDSMSARSIRCPACGEDMPMWASACWQCGEQLYLPSEQIEGPFIYPADNIPPEANGQIHGQVFSAYLSGNLGMTSIGSGGANAITKQENVTPLLPRPISRRRVLLGLAGLAVAGGMIGLGVDAAIRLLKYSPTLVTYRGHNKLVHAVAWAPDGKRIASASDDGTVQVWEALTGKLLITYRGHNSGVQAAAWSPDGRLIASGGSSYEGKHVSLQVWDASTGMTRLIYSDSMLYDIPALAWSPDGTRIVFVGGYGDPVRVWDVATQNMLLTYTGHGDLGANAVAWSPDGTRIASGGALEDKTIQIWDATTGETLLTYRGHGANEEFCTIYAVAWSPDSKFIVSSAEDGTVQVWNAASGQRILTYLGHGGQEYNSVNSVAWSPDGRRIASGGDDETVQVWDALTGDHAFYYTGQSSSVISVAWSPDGHYIASSGENTVQVWQPV